MCPWKSLPLFSWLVMMGPHWVPRRQPLWLRHLNPPAPAPVEQEAPLAPILESDDEDLPIEPSRFHLAFDLFD